MKEIGIQRDYLFDNLKFILITLVVIGHLVELVRNVYIMNCIYIVIYFFHMPAMILISGYFAKSSVKDGKLVKNKIINYILIYGIFQFILMILSDSNFSIFNAKFGLWYLQFLIAALLMLPIISRIKPKYAVTFSFLFSLLIGFDDFAGHTASLSRIFVFLPFYLIGYYLKQETVNKITKNQFLKLFSFIIFGVIIFGICKYLVDLDWTYNLIRGNISYDNMNLSNIYGLILRTFWIAISLLICFLLIILVPSKKSYFTKFGTRTLQVYLLHIIIIVILIENNISTIILKYNNNLMAIVLVLLGIIVSCVLSLKIFSYPFDFLMKLKFNKFMLNKK